MINLLPNETKKQLRAAHANVVLSRYLGILGIGGIFLLLACITSYIFLINNDPGSSNNTTSGQSGSQLYSTNKDLVALLQRKLPTVKSILSQQVSYSEVITEIAEALPSGMVLNELSVDNNMLGMPITLVISARSTDNIEKLKTNFSNTSSGVLYDFAVQSNNQSSNNTSGYPILLNCVVKIKKGIIQ